MNKVIHSKGMAIAAVAAALFTIAPLAANADGGSSNGACFGVNACKGKSSCKSANNACKGLNGCKGKGFVEEVSRETCDQLGGHFRTYDDVKQEQAQH
jgi:uncharacterized membrane protein